ncbi:MAG: c-type cytochrome [Magnetococcales bacterium]|nr:c-type cytochrome [Magnetococcales bacterium]
MTLFWFWSVLLAMSLSPAAWAVQDGLLEAGRKIYNFRCYFCHGYSGDARTLAASYMATQPRNFMASDPQEFPLERLEKVIAEGRPKTAMPGFATVLTPEEIHRVASFVRERFMIRHDPNTRYHTAENGWPDHVRYQAAFPFATGEVALDAGEETLNQENKIGKKLFMTACITCHDRARTENDGPIWESHAVSWPRNRYSHRSDPPLDAVSGATPYARHETPPRLPDLSPTEQHGAALFQKNCAFCHAADGTGRNYIGTFLDPHPRDLTTPGLLFALDLEAVIRDGLPNTSMPAWGTVLTTKEMADIIAYIRRAFGTTSQSQRGSAE